jgi:CubicO group peptidase (beta-lactamase class C family)
MESTFKKNIKGYVKPGFEHVYDQFESLIENKHDSRSQLCVYVGGEIVIDLSRGVKPESMTTIYSSGKSVAAILLALLHDKGLF